MTLKSTLDDIKSRLTALLTYANGVTGESDTSIGDAIETLADGYGQGGSSLPIQMELIGTWTGYLSEYTNTSTAESTDTGINIKNTNYAYIIITVYCDGQRDTSVTNAWCGISLITGGRYKSNGNFAGGGNMTYRNCDQPEDFSEINGSPLSNTTYGITLNNNSQNIVFNRKCHGTAMPKIMGGNYTVNVYGISGI